MNQILPVNKTNFIWRCLSASDFFSGPSLQLLYSCFITVEITFTSILYTVVIVVTEFSLTLKNDISLATQCNEVEREMIS